MRLPIAASLCPTEDSVGPWSCLDTISTSSDADIVGDVDSGWCGFQAESDRCPTDRWSYSYRRVNGCSIKCNTSLLKSILSISSCFTEGLPNCHHHGCHHHNCQVNCQPECQPECHHKCYPKCQGTTTHCTHLNDDLHHTNTTAITTDSILEMLLSVHHKHLSPNNPMG